VDHHDEQDEQNGAYEPPAIVVRQPVIHPLIGRQSDA
jgi:hypothetical protein